MTPELIAACARSAGAEGRFGIIFSCSRQRSEFGVGSKPAGCRLRPQFRGFGAQGLRAGLLGNGV